ncbi:MAG TPA: hypothetical protein VHL09_15865 [Dehalococcoidia bacterium]|nr:hypothetical protein [Dehalococcoidia bacterium]
MTETTGDPGDRLAEFLDQLEAGQLTIEQTRPDGANLDPEFFGMVHLANQLGRFRHLELASPRREAIREHFLRQSHAPFPNHLGQFDRRADLPDNRPSQRGRTLTRWVGRLVVAAAAASLLLGALDRAPEIPRQLVDYIATQALGAEWDGSDDVESDRRTPGAPSNRGDRPTVAEASSATLALDRAR